MIDRYAVIGNPIGHSKSPPIHTAFAQQTGQQLTYTAVEAHHDGFADVVAAFRASGGKGLNVTMPFKGAAFAYATHFTERARITQSVNTLTFDGADVAADTTDGAGLVRDIQVNVGIPIRGKSVLLLGAGGAVRSVVLTLLEQAPTQIVIVNRNGAKALALQHQFAAYGIVRAGSYADIANEAFDLVINGTSASLSDELPPLAPTSFAPGSLAYDMVYGKGITRFMAYAQEHGAQQSVDGLGMLIEGAAEAFLRWRGVRPDTQPIFAMFQTSSRDR